MTVQTKNGLLVQADEKQKITLPQGLFGFENMHNFVLLDCEYKPFYWMQSLDNKDLAFLIVDPFLFFSDYEIDADDKTLSSIDLTNPEDVKIMCIVTVPADNSGVTANLQGPLIINKANNKCMQIILTDERWQTKHNLLEQVKQGAN